jgi:hypothetical protein
MVGGMDSNWVPQPKVAAAGAAGSAALVLVWLLAEFGVTMPAEVASAITALAMSAVAYFWPQKTSGE